MSLCCDFASYYGNEPQLVRTFIICSTLMEPELFDPFAVFKRGRPADMKIEDKGRKILHQESKSPPEPVSDDHTKIDPMALLETNLVKESIANTQP